MTEPGEVNGVRFLAGTIIDAQTQDADKLIRSGKAVRVDEMAILSNIMMMISPIVMPMQMPVMKRQRRLIMIHPHPQSQMMIPTLTHRNRGA